MSIFVTVFGLLGFGILMAFALVSRHENEARAATRSVLFGLIFLVFFLTLAWLPGSVYPILGTAVALAMVAGGVFLVLPTGIPEGYPRQETAPRVDERTIMFSRAELKPGSERHRGYYQNHPEHVEPDDNFRRLPGLMNPQAGKYEPISFTASEATFATVDRLAEMISGPVADQTTPLDAEAASRFLKGWARQLGAIDAGITRLAPEHFYTVKGRGARYGQAIEADHHYGLAFTVEMNHRQLGTAPEGPTLMESAQQYLNAGTIAVQLAECIRRLGYPAEAHIDGNYRVICPLVARDAGLGEIGRMGLLMTPQLGPRVRLGVVTTDLPLLPDPPGHDPSVLDFCSICKKCAEVCPAQAIPEEGRQTRDGVTRWQIDSETCFTFWCASGTDCGRCMKVCPYSHPDSWMHNLVRWGLGRSSRFRRFALVMDDLLYGRQPKIMEPASWLPRRSRRQSGS